jgi:hypothetical protein
MQVSEEHTSVVIAYNLLTDSFASHPLQKHSHLTDL